MSEGAGVRVRRQPERLHPGNHLKNLNNTLTNALVVVEEEPKSAENQEKRQYSDLDSLDGLFSGEIFLRTSFTQCNNGKTKLRPETLSYKSSFIAIVTLQSQKIYPWVGSISFQGIQALHDKIPPADLCEKK